MTGNNETPAPESDPSEEVTTAAPESASTEPSNEEVGAAFSSLSIQQNQPTPAVEEVSDDDGEEEDGNLPQAHEDIRAEFLSLLPPAVHSRIDSLKSLHTQRDEVLVQYQAERAALESKYAELMMPLYENRRKIVNGDLDQEEDAPSGGEEVKGIPQFWACAMGNMDVIAELIAEEDVDCLEFLSDIKCNNFPDGSGFELAFHFSENPYFTNSILVKRYEVPNLLTEDEPILKNVTGTDINWKSGQSLTFKKVMKKQRKKGGRGAGQIRTISKNERQESFFHFFSPPKIPALAQIMDEEEAEAMEEAFDHDYDVAQAFRGCIIPKAVLWFTGEAMEEGYDDLDGFIAGEDEDGDDDDDDDDNNNSGGRSGDAGTGSAPEFQFKFDGGAGVSPQPGVDGENPECKQS